MIGNNIKWNKVDLVYVGAIAALMLLKLVSSTLETSSLIWLLWPVALFILFFTSSPYVFIADQGYYFPDLNVLIDSSCSGLNYFILISIYILSFSLFIQRPGNIRNIFYMVGFGYAATIAANGLRIHGLIILEKYEYFGMPTDWINLHEAFGVFIFFTVLLTISMYLNSLRKTGNISLQEKK
ncbi:MAG: exosortase K [Leptospirales bacterium]